MMFKEKFRDFQELIREHTILRNHNQKFKERDPQKNLLLFAEGAIVVMIIERFLRILPGVGAADGDKLQRLLKKATSKKILSISPKQQKGIVDIRNTILHGNFEQAARQAGVGTKEAYFKSQFVAEIEALFKIANVLVDQIDPKTGNPKE
jgi:hypothetical protein